MAINSVLFFIPLVDLLVYVSFVRKLDQNMKRCGWAFGKNQQSGEAEGLV